MAVVMVHRHGRVEPCTGQRNAVQVAGRLGRTIATLNLESIVI